jgi:hypothetical protein
MAMVRSLALLAGSVVGYALAHRVGLCAPDGGCLTWGMLVATGGVGTLAQEVAALLLDSA